MLPFDVTELLRGTLADDRRPPDGKLHPSGDLIGSLRHAQLRAAGAPTVASEIVSDVRLMTGTMWHTYFEQVFRQAKLPVMCEVKLDPWLPEGWSGTADWIAWDGEADKGRGAFVLGDLKTIKGEGMSYVQRDGIKQEHLWQLSAYWYALEAMGLPLVRGFAVFYLPQNVPARDETLDPLMCEGQPLPADQVIGTMNERWEQTQAYLTSIEQGNVEKWMNATLQDFLSDDLAPEQERVQGLRWNKAQSCWDLKLVPHWSADYCPYPEELCSCRSQGQTKIGAYSIDPEGTLTYAPRSGHEDITPELEPSGKDVLKKARELNG